jgi:hypothetical protein
MYCNDEMLRIIGRTIEHVIGRSSEQLEGVEAEAKISGGAEGDGKTGKEDDKNVVILDIIDASGFLHKGSALSTTFKSVAERIDRMSISCAIAAAAVLNGAASHAAQVQI